MYIKEISIGNIKIKNNIFLAPMAGFADRAFRKICADYGAGLVYTEMVSAKGIVYNDEKTLELVKCDIFNMPRVVQIFGSEPDIISQAIQKIDDYADIIDINMGCPVPKIVNNGEGSALLKNPELVGEIVKAAVKATNKPITVKIRKGFDDFSINCVEIAKIAEMNGAKAITIHGRTRKDFYTGTCDLDCIKSVKEAVSISVIGNGDVVDYESFKRMIDYTGVDAVMIGRGSLGKPWIFKEIIDKENNSELFNIYKKEILEKILEQYNLEIEQKGEYVAVREMRKHICCYVKGMSKNSELKNTINTRDNAKEVFEILKEYMN